jgi:hypothetical protein
MSQRQQLVSVDQVWCDGRKACEPIRNSGRGHDAAHYVAARIIDDRACQEGTIGGCRYHSPSENSGYRIDRGQTRDSSPIRRDIGVDFAPDHRLAHDSAHFGVVRGPDQLCLGQDREDVAKDVMVDVGRVKEFPSNQSAQIGQPRGVAARNTSDV